MEYRRIVKWDTNGGDDYRVHKAVLSDRIERAGESSVPAVARSMRTRTSVGRLQGCKVCREKLGFSPSVDAGPIADELHTSSIP
jgi:hypothetical protein